MLWQPSPQGFAMISRGLALTALASLLAHLAMGTQRENHFGNPCTLCQCFITYTDRDVAVSSNPYKVAMDPYDSSEDRCLSTCMQEKDCKAVVYGYVGGRDVFTCELYNKTSTDRPIYTPFTNTYIRRFEGCSVPTSDFDPLSTHEGDERVVARKNKFMKLAYQLNPYYFG